jgi:hypothetical protein
VSSGSDSEPSTPVKTAFTKPHPETHVGGYGLPQTSARNLMQDMDFGSDLTNALLASAFLAQDTTHNLPSALPSPPPPQPCPPSHSPSSSSSFPYISSPSSCSQLAQVENSTGSNSYSPCDKFLAPLTAFDGQHIRSHEEDLMATEEVVGGSNLGQQQEGGSSTVYTSLNNAGMSCLSYPPFAIVAFNTFKRLLNVYRLYSCQM